MNIINNRLLRYGFPYVNMAERGRIWSDSEVQALLALWSEEGVQRELLGAFRKEPVWKRLAEELQKQGYTRSSKQVASKIKQLKKHYKAAVDKLRKSGVGLESDDDSDIYVGFKWFLDLHTVMRRRAVVNPPALLESTSSAVTLPTQGTTATNTRAANATAASATAAAAEPESSATLAEVPGDYCDELELPESSLPQSSTDAHAASDTSVETGSSNSAPIATNKPNSTKTSEPPGKKRRLTKLQKADKTTAGMFEAMIEMNKEADVRQEIEHQERLKKQEELLNAQEQYLRRQEAREEQFMTILQQLVSAITPAAVPRHHCQPLHNPAASMMQDDPSGAQQNSSFFPYSTQSYPYDDN